jgi:hypothetical protein
MASAARACAWPIPGIEGSCDATADALLPDPARATGFGRRTGGANGPAPGRSRPASAGDRGAGGAAAAGPAPQPGRAIGSGYSRGLRSVGASGHGLSAEPAWRRAAGGSPPGCCSPGSGGSIGTGVRPGQRHATTGDRGPHGGGGRPRCQRIEPFGGQGWRCGFHCPNHQPWGSGQAARGGGCRPRSCGGRPARRPWHKHRQGTSRWQGCGSEGSIGLRCSCSPGSSGGPDRGQRPNRAASRGAGVHRGAPQGTAER